MSICIKTATGDILWFDAVTSYSNTYSSQVSSHPLETGAKVTDHTVRENPRIKLAGVFSDFDPNTTRSVFNFIVNQTDAVNSTRIVNNEPKLDAVVIPNGGVESTPIGASYTIIPLGDVVPVAETIKRIFTELHKNQDVVTVIEFDGNVIKANGYYPNAVITSIAFNEDADSGDALYVDLDIEIVTFVDLKKVALPKQLLASSRAKNKKPSAKETATGNADSKDDAKKKNPSQQRSVLDRIIN